MENAFLMGQQLPPARAPGVGVMREIALGRWAWRFSPINEDLLLPAAEACMCSFRALEAEEEVGLSQRES